MANKVHPSRVSERRDFLRRISGTVAASGMILSGAVEAQDTAPAAAAEPLPTTSLGKHRLTRLITGWNPIGGTSHSTLNASLHMREYFTVDRTFDFIGKCESAGINTWQLDHDEKAIAVIRRLRERGSKMQFICLHSEAAGNAPLKAAAADLGAIAFVHHGKVTDSHLRSGRGQAVRDYVKKVHDLGLLAGVSTHSPEHLKRIADEGWENDFFMTCFYNVGRPPAEQRKLFGTAGIGDPFFDADPPAMTKVIRQVEKPCLAYKILAAGRICLSPRTAKAAVDRAFKFAFDNIKPKDAVIVGMFPVYYDELSDNVAYVRKYGAVG